MEYLFDTNIFVDSKKNLPMDVWPTFWTKMVELINSGNIHSIDKVKEKHSLASRRNNLNRIAKKINKEIK